jgi:uncharacterized protein (TIGR03545 family)
VRKNFVYFVLVPLVLLVVVLYFFLDRWVEAGLETAGESLVGAKVEIDDLRLSLSPLGMEFQRLQVASPRDPWKNLFETGRVNFKMNFGQLLRGKYIIDSIEVRTLLLGTARATDGSLRRPPATEQQGEGLSGQISTYVAQRTSDAPVFDLENLRRQLNLDSLLSLRSLQSVRHLDSLKQLAQSFGDNWNLVLADVNQGKEKLRSVETSIRGININELKSVEALAAAVGKIGESSRAVEELNQSFQTRKNTITADVQQLTAGLGAIDDVLREDIRALQDLARLPDLSLGGISTLLLGPSLLQEAKAYLAYVDLAGSTIRKYRPKPSRENPPRFAGQNISFPVERAYPKFWVRTIHVSGGTASQAGESVFSASGDIRDVTDNQDLTGQPTVLALAGSQAGRAAFTLRASLDRRGETSLDQYRLAVTSIPVGRFSLGRSAFLPSRIAESVADIDVDLVLPGGRFDARTALLFRNMSLVFDAAPRNTVERLTRDVLGQISSLRASFRLWNTAGPLDAAFSSDLDDQLRSRIQRVLGEELARIQNDIRSRVNQQIAAKRAEVQQMIEQKKKEVQARIQEYEALLKEKLALAEAKKKELEQRIEEEKRKQTDAAKKKVEDAVKGIFKKKQ